MTWNRAATKLAPKKLKWKAQKTGHSLKLGTLKYEVCLCHVLV
jgi:hypothetical protein